MIRSMREIAEQAMGTSGREGGLARPLDRMVSRLPSDTFLWLGWGSVVAALALWLSGRQRSASFVGLWAPTFLIHGIYVKLVKQLGSGRQEEQ